jgi:O-methyltransferase
MGDDRFPIGGRNPAVRVVTKLTSALLRPLGLDLCHYVPFEQQVREEGRDWPGSAETMIGLKRLDNIEECIGTIIREGILGDVLEAGVWRGGAAIFMRAALNILGARERLVWVADSFQGLPPPDPNVPADKGVDYYRDKVLAVSLDTVRANFAKYDLLSDQVRFLEGWFSTTLPTAPIERLALLRADGDMYASTMDILTPLYPKVSPGGFVIIDDYHAVDACRQAVDDFRSAHDVQAPLVQIDWSGVYWRKESATAGIEPIGAPER